VVGRLSTYEGPADAIDPMRGEFERLTDELRTLDGFEQAYLLVDRGSGEAMTLTVWDNEAAAESSAERAREMREQVAAAAQHEIKGVRNYEIALRVGRLTDS
jgi:heme-degrading monooxygenase HmoA